MIRSILCAWYQWRISSALDAEGSAAARLPARHMVRCAACREFYERGAALAEGLRAAAPALAESSAESTLHRVRRPARLWAWAAGLTAAACVAAVLAAAAARWGAADPQKTAIAPSPSPQPTAPAVRPSPEDAARAIAVASDPLGALKEAALPPIDRRIEQVRKDARATGDFLVSLLPDASK